MSKIDYTSRRRIILWDNIQEKIKTDNTTNNEWNIAKLSERHDNVVFYTNKQEYGPIDNKVDIGSNIWKNGLRYTKVNGVDPYRNTVTLKFGGEMQTITLVYDPNTGLIGFGDTILSDYIIGMYTSVDNIPNLYDDDYSEYETILRNSTSFVQCDFDKTYKYQGTLPNIIFNYNNLDDDSPIFIVLPKFIYNYLITDSDKIIMTNGLYDDDAGTEDSSILESTDYFRIRYTPLSELSNSNYVVLKAIGELQTSGYIEVIYKS